MIEIEKIRCPYCNEIINRFYISEVETTIYECEISYDESDDSVLVDNYEESGEIEQEYGEAICPHCQQVLSKDIKQKLCEIISSNLNY